MVFAGSLPFGTPELTSQRPGKLPYTQGPLFFVSSSGAQPIVLCYTALHLTCTLWWAWPEFAPRLSFSSPSTHTERCTQLGGLWPDEKALPFGSSPWAGKKPSLLDSLGGLRPVAV